MISVYYSLGEFGTKSNPLIPLNGLASYSHSIESIGGYTSAQFSFNCSLDEAEDWVFGGVGKNIRAFNELGNIVWEGIVDEISFDIGPRSIKVGQYINIANRIKVAYSLRNPPLGTPDEEKYLETNWATDADSISRYGYLSEIISGGTGYSQEMDKLRDNSLAFKIEPHISETISTGRNVQNVTIAVSCIGYTRLFEKQYYNYGTTTEYGDLSKKVRDIILANKSVDTIVFDMAINPVSVQVLLHETKSREAWSIIKDDISKSDNGGIDIVCGMFGDRTFVLDKVSSRQVYTRDGGSSVIRDSGGNIVPASEILPGTTMSNNDLSRTIRYIVNSISYTMSSNSVQINQKDSSLRTVMSRTMLGGFL